MSDPRNELPYPVFIGEVIGFITLFVVLLLQLLIEVIERYGRRHKTAHEIIGKAFRETTIFGLVSLSLFIFERTHLFGSSTVEYELGLVHIGIWVLAVTYLIWTTALLLTSRHLSHEWRRLEEVYGGIGGLERYRGLKELLEKETSESGLFRAFVYATSWETATEAPEKRSGQIGKKPSSTLTGSADGDEEGGQDINIKQPHAPMPPASSPVPPTPTAPEQASPPAFAGLAPAATLRSSLTSFISDPDGLFLRLATMLATYLVPLRVTSLLAIYIIHPRRAQQYMRTLHDARFMELRARFIARHGLSDSFSFARYLHQAKMHVVLKLVEIPVEMWASFLALICLDLFVRSISGWYANNVRGDELVCTLAVAMAAGIIIVFLKMRYIFVRILHSEFATTIVEASDVVARASSWNEVINELSYRTFRSRPSFLMAATERDRDEYTETMRDYSRFLGKSESLRTRGSSPAPKALAERSAENSLPPAQSPQDKKETSSPMGPTRYMSRGVKGDFHETKRDETAYNPPSEPERISPQTVYSDAFLRSFHNHEQAEAERRHHRRLMTEQRNLFWFGRPLIMLRLVQLVPFFAGLAIALITILFSDMTDELKNILFAFALFPAVLVLSLILAAKTVSSYILSVHVSDLVDVKLLVESILLTERAHRAALAKQQLAVALATFPPQKPTLHQRIRYLESRTQMRRFLVALLLGNFFLITILASTYVTGALRIVVFALQAVLVLAIAIEFLLHIVATAPEAPNNILVALRHVILGSGRKKRDHCMHGFDVILTTSAVVGVTLGIGLGSLGPLRDSNNITMHGQPAPLVLSSVVTLRLLSMPFSYKRVLPDADGDLAIRQEAIKEEELMEQATAIDALVDAYTTRQSSARERYLRRLGLEAESRNRPQQPSIASHVSRRRPRLQRLSRYTRPSLPPSFRGSALTPPPNVLVGAAKLQPTTKTEIGRRSRDELFNETLAVLEDVKEADESAAEDVIESLLSAEDALASVSGRFKRGGGLQADDAHLLLGSPISSGMDEVDSSAIKTLLTRRFLETGLSQTDLQKTKSWRGAK
jgi:hypothetical protein